MSLNDSDHDLLMRIDERMTAFITVMADKKIVDDRQEIRISKLENWRSYTAGSIGLIILFLGAVGLS